MGERLKLLIINGPNINMLGIREKNLYGVETYDDLLAFCSNAGELHGVDLEFYQSNHEGSLVDRIQEAYGGYDGIIINPAAYTHTSVAIADALKAVNIPTVEVHITDTQTREDYRKVSYVRDVCIATYQGYGFKGYEMAIRALCQYHAGDGDEKEKSIRES